MAGINRLSATLLWAGFKLNASSYLEAKTGNLGLRGVDSHETCEQQDHDVDVGEID
jgi:hypothetical protein